MEVEELLSRAQDAVSVRRVFGEPYEKDGVTIVPAAMVVGGGGGGHGEGTDGSSSGSGSGFGLVGRPVGAYVITDGNVSWRPALDVTTIVLCAQAVLITALLVRRTVGRSRVKHGRRR